MKTLVVAIVMLLAPGLALAQDDVKAGEAVYNQACKMCHGSGMMGAPKTGDKAAWGARQAAGAATLTQNTIKGVGKMPPRGNCKSCSDVDIANAVAYMLAQVK